MRKYSRHHRNPVSLGGENIPSNISILPKKLHSAWHTLVRNFSPQEIARVLSEDFLDPEWELVARRKNASTNTSSSRLDYG